MKLIFNHKTLKFFDGGKKPSVSQSGLACATSGIFPQESCLLNSSVKILLFPSAFSVLLELLHTDPYILGGFRCTPTIFEKLSLTQVFDLDLV